MLVFKVMENACADIVEIAFLWGTHNSYRLAWVP